MGMENVNKDIAQDDNKKKKKRMAIIIAAIVLIAAVIGIFLYTNAITAVTMRIQRLVGTVNLYNESGDEQSLREKMRLGAGQTVTTAGESLIMVSLDDTKLMTMEESSRAEIRTRGKKLLFELLEGNLFFNVTEKLKDNESFDVQTSTMICGIRGTSAYVGRDSTSHEILMVTDGLVHVVATNPVTLETTEVDVPAGQMITIYLDDEAEGNKTISIKMRSFVEEDLPALALDTMRKNKALMERVAKATGFSTKKLSTLADLSSTKGISMYGEAADDFRSEGVDDAIPFMGYHASEMISSANSALSIAKDDLPLEVAIIQGYRDVMDVGSSNGYDKDNLGTLMRGSRDVMERTFERVGRAGLKSVDRINVAVKVSETMRVSAGRMAGAKLSTKEIGDVMDATAQLFEGAVDEGAGGSNDGTKGSDVLASIDRMSEHVTGTVDEEMDKSSNGDETVIALLGSGKNSRSGKSSDEADVTVAADKNEDKKVNAAGTESAPAAGDGNNTAKVTGSNAAASNGTAATPQEIKAAKAAIAATDPDSGVVALADGTLFDPAYYAAANPDVVARYGTSTEALLAEWLNEGKAQGRPPIAPPVTASAPQQTSSGGSSHDDDDDDDDNDHDDSSSGSSGGGGSGGGGGGGGGGTPQVDSNNHVVINGTTYTYAGTPAKLSIPENANLSLPVTILDQSGTSVTISSLADVDMNQSNSSVTDTSLNWTRAILGDGTEVLADSTGAVKVTGAPSAQTLPITLPNGATTSDRLEYVDWANSVDGTVITGATTKSGSTVTITKNGPTASTPYSWTGAVTGGGDLSALQTMLTTN